MMKDKRGSTIDRRSGRERRKAYNLDYFLNGGVERRNRNDRRSGIERRAAWVRVGKWYSIYPWTALRFQNLSEKAPRHP
jgi:hypothetical protein